MPSVWYTSSPVAGAMIAAFCAALIRGTKIPADVDAISSIEEASAAAPVAFTAMPCACIAPEPNIVIRSAVMALMSIFFI